MTDFDWQGPGGTTSNPTSGEYHTASNWNPSGQPTNTDSATFNSGPYIVTVNGSDASSSANGDMADGISVGSGVTFDIINSETLGSEFGSISNSGTISVDSTSTLSDLVDMDNNGIIFVDGTFNSDSIANTDQIEVSGVVKFLNTSFLFTENDQLTGGGQIVLSGGTVEIQTSVKDPQFLENVDNKINGFGAFNSGIFHNDSAGIVDADGTSALTIATGNAVVNTGLLEGTGDAGSHGALVIADAVTNAGGTIEASGGGSVQANGAVTGGTIEAAAGGTLTLNGSSNGSAIMSTNQSGDTTGPSVVNVYGATQNCTFDASGTDSSGDQALIVLHGSCSGETLETGSSGLVLADNITLSSSANLGNLDIDEIKSGSSFAANTLTINTSLTNAGTISLAGADVEIALLVSSATTTVQGGGRITMTDGDQTVIDATTRNDALVNVDNTIAGNGSLGLGNLVLDNQGVVDATGGSPMLVSLSAGMASTNTGTMEATGGGELDFLRGTFTNAGAIDADGSSDVEFANTASITNGAAGTIEATNGGAIYIDAVTRHPAFFTNQGTIEAAAGSTVSIGAGATTNVVGGTLTGGTWEAVNGGTLVLSGAPITTDAATIALGGAGSVFEAGNGTTFTTIQQSLATIAAGGSLSFAAGYAFAGGMSGPFTNNGTLTMSGSGTSTIGTSLTSSGTINVAGGTLSVAGTVSLSGTLNVYTPPVAGVSAGTFSSGLITATAASTIAIGIGSGTVTSSLTDAGTVSVSTFAALTFTGASDTFSGAIKTIANGVGGTVAFAAGSDMLAKGASLALGTTAVSGAIVTLGTSLTDKGKLALSSGTLALGGYAFAVGSGSTLSGGTLSGTGTSTEGVLQAQGATTLSGLTVSGARLTNFGTLTETGTLSLAGASGIIDAEVNQKGAIWSLSDNAALTLTGAATDTFSNVGTLQKTTGTGKAVVGVAVANTGTISATSGTLDLASTVAGTGTETIGAAGILELGKAIAATQALTFSGIGGQLLLDDAHDFHAGVTGFAKGDAMDLSTFASSGETFTYTPSGSGAPAGGTLAITSGANTASIALHGSYTANQFHLASDGHGGTSVTYG